MEFKGSLLEHRIKIIEGILNDLDIQITKLEKIKGGYKMTEQYLINQRKEIKIIKQLKDKQLKRILADIENKKQNYEEDNFKAGYIQAMLNYGIISSEQYESIYT